MKKCLSGILFVAILVVALPNGLSADPTVLHDNLQDQKIGLNVSILEDKNQEYTIQDVVKPELADRFVPSQEECINRGFTDSAYWVRFTVINPGSEKCDWLLEVTYPMIDSIAFFAEKEGTFEKREAGDMLPFNYREIDYPTFVFPVATEPGAKQTYVMRFSTSSSMNIGLRIWSPPLFEKSKNNRLMMSSAFFSSIVIMIFYNLLLFFSSRDFSYLYHALFVSAAALLLFTLYGLSFQYLWPTSIWWANNCIPVLIFLCNIFCVIFARSFLGTKQATPAMDRALLLYIILNCCFLVVTPFLSYSSAIQIATLMAIFAALLPLIISVKLSFRNRQGWFYLAAWLSLLFGITVYGLKTFGILPSGFVTEHSMTAGLLLETILLSLGVGDKINAAQREKIAAFRTIQNQKEKLLQEIHEREKIQKNLSESEERFRILSDGTFEAILLHDNGRILQANPQYYSMFGYTPEELEGKDAISLTATPESIDIIKKEIARGNLGPYEVTGQKKDGTQFPMEIQASVIEYKGRKRRMTAIRDISDRKRIEAEKIALERRITGGFAHEMRNALSGTQLELNNALNYQGKGTSFSGVLKDAATQLMKSINEIHETYKIPKDTILSNFIPELKTIAEISDSLSEIHSDVARDIDRGLAITNKIREYAKISELKKGNARVDIAEILKAYAGEYKQAFEAHGIAYSLEGPDKCILKGDETQLNSIFSNLILNAKDALADCGRENPEIRVTVEKSDGRIKIAVEDNGPGIQEKHLKEVFEPFFSTKPTTGTGLGLSIVNRLVRLHEGKIGVETRSGNGTVFKITFPENFDE